MNILSQGRSRQYKVTRPASISATTRLPSHLVSNTQSGSSNGASVKVASIGCNRFGSFDSLAIQLCPGSARPARACFRIAGASEHAASRSSGQENGLSTVSNNLSSPSKRRPPSPASLASGFALAWELQCLQCPTGRRPRPYRRRDRQAQALESGLALFAAPICSPCDVFIATRNACCSTARQDLHQLGGRSNFPEPGSQNPGLIGDLAAFSSSAGAGNSPASPA